MDELRFRGLEPVVITSDDDLHEELFSGYAFSGNDFILGAQGLRFHRGEHGEKFSHHEDGCYFLATPTASGMRVGTDFKGNCKIFVYRRNDRWAISNSFMELVDAVRKKAWPLTVLPHVVDSWGVPGRFWDQCWSYGTAVKEISLLPRWATLAVSSESIVETDPIVQRNEDSYEAYAEGLADYLNTWIGRIGTILNDEALRVQLEITGGKDSRGVLALFLAARQYFGVNLDGKFDLLSSRSPGREADLDVAKGLAESYRLPLNSQTFDPGPATYMSASEQMNWWATFAFGSYRPIYLVSSRRHLSTLPFGGQGGEGTRQQYEPFGDLDAILTHYSKYFGFAKSVDAVAADLEATKRRIRGWMPRTPETLAHYQEFRDRFHSGMHPQTRPRVIPLTGRHLHSAARSLPETLLLAGQALRDVTAQSAPGLLSRPYEDPRKAPTTFNVESLAHPLPLSPELGKVYGEVSWSAPERPAKESAWSLVLERLAEAVRRVPEELVPKKTVQLARKRARETPDTTGSATAGPSRPIHHVLLADYLAGNPL